MKYDNNMIKLTGTFFILFSLVQLVFPNSMVAQVVSWASIVFGIWLLYEGFKEIPITKDFDFNNPPKPKSKEIKTLSKKFKKDGKKLTKLVKEEIRTQDEIDAEDPINEDSQSLPEGTEKQEDEEQKP